jgi:hypothetical protein
MQCTREEREQCPFYQQLGYAQARDRRIEICLADCAALLQEIIAWQHMLEDMYKKLRKGD